MRVALVVFLLGLAAVGQTLASGSYGSNANFCVGCKSIVSFATRFNSTEHRPEYRQLVSSFCSHYYPASTDYQQGPCALFVETLFYVVDRVDPVRHCDQIGACVPKPSKQLNGGGQHRLTLETILSPLRNPTNFDEQDKPKQEIPSYSVGLSSDAICDACQQIVDQLQQFLRDPKNVDQFRNRLNALCDYLKLVDEDRECKRVLVSQFDQAIDFIKHIDAFKYCASIQLCQRSSSSSQLGLESLPQLSDFSRHGIETMVEVDNKLVKDVRQPHFEDQPQLDAGLSVYRHDDGPQCVICQTIVKELFRFLRQNTTEENIELAMDKVCDSLYKEGPKRQHCMDMVKIYSRELVEMLVDETDPEMICMVIEQCKFQQSTQVARAFFKTPPVDMGHFIAMLEPGVQPGSMRSCLECKAFIDYVKSTLDDPKSADYVQKWLEQNLCKTLPEESSRNACNSLVTNYSEVFFKAVSDELQPQESCEELGACRHRPHNQANKYQLLNLLESLPEPVSKPSVMKVLTITKDEPICDQCVDIVTQIDSYLSKHSIDKNVSVLVDKVCKPMPESTRQQCTDLIKNFGNFIVNAVANMDNPRDLCTKMYMC